jgi:hypothetical protein
MKKPVTLAGAILVFLVLAGIDGYSILTRFAPSPFALTGLAVADFQPFSQELPRRAEDARSAFTAHGVTRAGTAFLVAIIQGQRAEAAGSFSVELHDYGMAPPENRVAAVDSTVTIELHVFLEHV